MARERAGKNSSRLTHYRAGAFEIGPYVILRGNEHIAEASYLMMRKILLAKGWEWNEEIDSVCRKLAQEDADRYQNEFKSLGFPNHVRQLFAYDEKRDAERWARENQVSSDDIVAMIHNAKDENLRYEPMFREFVPADIPRLGVVQRVRPDEFEIVGEPSGDEHAVFGQMKRIFDQRRNNSIHMFRKKQKWFCFFFTFQDIQGHHGEIGPHLHFVSHLWGIPRSHVWNSLKERQYAIPSVHVQYQNTIEMDASE